jgi:hypothetical protein
MYIGSGLECELRWPRRNTVRRADSKDTFTAAKVLYPISISSEIPVTRMAETSRMRVHDSNDRQTTITLANDPTADSLSVAVESNVRDTGLTFGAGWQCGQRDGLSRVPQPQQHPPGLFVTSRFAPMQGKFFEQRSANAVGD